MIGRTVRLTVAQALVRYLTKQMTVIDGETLPIVAGCWAIFGHGNVAGIGEALYQARDRLPTWRAHNEQGMALAATAYAKAMFRRRFMACTTSIGPGALNMVTAAAVAHVDRLPLLLLPGDVFANRLPDPVLQQIEDFKDGTVSANDCFKPVSRYFDRINRPEQLIPALQRAMSVLTDPADCGPVTLAMCQDVQTEAYDWPESVFAEKVWTPRRVRPDEIELAAAVAAIKAAKRPMIIAGGGVLYSEASAELTRFAETHAIPVAVSQAGKSAIDETHPLALGAVGVTGTSAATRWRPTPTSCLRSERACRTSPRARGRYSSRTPSDRRAQRRALRHGQARRRASGLRRQGRPRGAVGRAPRLASRSGRGGARGEGEGDLARRGGTGAGLTNAELPSDAQVIGAVARTLGPDNTIVVNAAGGLLGELHKLWVPPRRAAITWNMASPAWATRSPAAWASRWRGPTGRSSSWSATAPT